MKANVSIGGIAICVEVECADPFVRERAQMLVENAHERIEHAIGQAICAELKLILPGIEAQVTGMNDQE